MNLSLPRLYAFLMIPLLTAAILFFGARYREASEMVKREAIVRIGDQTWTAEVAQTPVAQAKGLSDRDLLCDACAMLFHFDESGQYGFWMKGMRFPLDLAWIRNGRIIHIERNIPADFQGVMMPAESADTVLEVNAYALDGVSVGASVNMQ